MNDSVPTSSIVKSPMKTTNRTPKKRNSSVRSTTLFSWPGFGTLIFQPILQRTQERPRQPLFVAVVCLRRMGLSAKKPAKVLIIFESCMPLCCEVVVCYDRIQSQASDSCSVEKVFASPGRKCANTFINTSIHFCPPTNAIFSMSFLCLR